MKYVANPSFFSAAGDFFLKNDRNQWFLYRNNIFMTLFYTHMLIKFHQNLEKLSFSMTFIGFYQTLIEISSKNNQKRSKMIKKIGTEFRSFLHILKELFSNIYWHVLAPAQRAAGGKLTA